MRQQHTTPSEEKKKSEANTVNYYAYVVRYLPYVSINFRYLLKPTFFFSNRGFLSERLLISVHVQIRLQPSPKYFAITANHEIFVATT